MIEGYVVVHPCGQALEYCVGGIEEDSLALWCGDKGTLFRSYDAARNAIRRTKRYAKREGLPWPIEKYKIQRLAAPTPPAEPAKEVS